LNEALELEHCIDSEFARAKTLNRIFDLITRPIVRLQLLGCCVSDNSLHGCYHRRHGVTFAQFAKFPSGS
jgi:hypothetical protein